MFVSGGKIFLAAAFKTGAERSRILAGICSATSVLSHSCCLLSYRSSVIRRFLHCDTKGIKHQKHFVHGENTQKRMMYPITLNVLLLLKWMILFFHRLSQYLFIKRCILWIFFMKGDKTKQKAICWNREEFWVYGIRPDIYTINFHSNMLHEQKT